MYRKSRSFRLRIMRRSRGLYIWREEFKVPFILPCRIMTVNPCITTGIRIPTAMWERTSRTMILLSLAGMMIIQKKISIWIWRVTEHLSVPTAGEKTLAMKAIFMCPITIPISAFTTLYTPGQSPPGFMKRSIRATCAAG